jgi:hypothetical protein
MATQQVVANSSEQVAGSPAASTGTSGGSAGNNTTGSGAGAVPTSTPVVAPKGFRSELQLMLQGWQELIPSDSVLTSSGNSLSEAGVVAQLQGYLGAYTALDASATADQEARDQVASQLAEQRKYYALLKDGCGQPLRRREPPVGEVWAQGEEAATPADERAARGEGRQGQGDPRPPRDEGSRGEAGDEGRADGVRRPGRDDDARRSGSGRAGGQCCQPPGWQVGAGREPSAK